MAANSDDEHRFRRANGYQGRLSIWEILGIVSTFRLNVERLKLYKATLSVVRFMAVLNFIYTVVGSAFLIIGLSPKVYGALEITPGQSAQFRRLGKLFSHLYTYNANGFSHIFVVWTQSRKLLID